MSIRTFEYAKRHGYSWAEHMLVHEGFTYFEIENRIKDQATEYSSEHGLSRHDVHMHYSGFYLGAKNCLEVYE